MIGILTVCFHSYFLLFNHLQYCTFDFCLQVLSGNCFSLGHTEQRVEARLAQCWPLAEPDTFTFML